mmetsp:Transcript_42795/g.112577  ORF Transcript_42795/g.112577 Transcript_42795/m.112577 type:complete len:482 (+) Transcript_42795:23-1468(+)
MARHPAATTLLRAILRAGARLDKSRTFRVLLSAPRDREYDLCLGNWSDIEDKQPTGSGSAEELSAMVLDDAVRSLCRGARLYPGPYDGPYEGSHAGLVAVLKAAMRNVLHEHPHVPAPSPAPPVQLLIDAGFALLRRLEAGIAMGERVVAPEAPAEDALQIFHVVPPAPSGPRPGDVLVSHPLLRRDAILILSADGPDGFAMGLVTNCPTALRIGSTPITAGRGQTVGPPVTRSGAGEHWTTGRRRLTDELASRRQVRDAALGVFADHVIYAGGMDGAGNLTMLHNHGDVRGCARVSEGLFYGGDLQHAASLVEAGEAEATDFVFFKGRHDWRPGELRGELELGEWVLATPLADAPPLAVAPPALQPGARSPALQLGDETAGGSEVADASTKRWRQDIRHEGWRRIVVDLVTAPACGDAPKEPLSRLTWRDGLRSWLTVRPMTEKEAGQLAAMHARGRGADAHNMQPPPWRTREDWEAEGA